MFELYSRLKEATFCLMRALLPDVRREIGKSGRDISFLPSTAKNIILNRWLRLKSQGALLYDWELLHKAPNMRLMSSTGKAQSIFQLI